MTFFAQMGPFQAPMLVLAAVVIGLAGWRAMQLFGSAGPAPSIEGGINSVLFWGVVAALVGFLGFFSGVYASLNGVLRMQSPGPGYIAKGVAESLTVSIAGLAILVIAAIAWFVLRARLASLTSIADGGAR